MEDMNMKKLIIAAVAAALVIGTGTTSALAAGCRHNCTNRNCNYTQSACPDKDRDGICDTCGKRIGKNGYCKNHCGSNSRRNGNGHGGRHHR